jgi:biopolymer transport protein ExbD
MDEFRKSPTIGSPFRQVKQLLATPSAERGKVKQLGIPTDSTNNELADWITAAKTTFGAGASRQVAYMIKGDNLAKYPKFNGVLDAMRKSDQFSYKLVTDPKSVPPGTELYKTRK